MRDGLQIFPLAFDEPASFLNCTQSLKDGLASGVPFAQLSDRSWTVYRRNAQAPYALVLLGKSASDLLREIELLEQTGGPCWSKGCDWKTTSGSCFSPRPLGRTGKLAFVYPGIGSAYLGCAADLFEHFPEVYQHLAPLSRNQLERLIHWDLLCPPDLGSSSSDEISLAEDRLYANALVLGEIGVMLAYVYTRLLYQILRVRPNCAFGNSLGEVAMFASLGTWKQPELLADRLGKSNVYLTRLHGAMDAVREFWSLPPAGNLQPTSLWESILLKSHPEAVREALHHEPRAYLTHINTSDEVILGGDPQAVQRVAERLRAAPVVLPFRLAMHCEAMHSEAARLDSLYTLEVGPRPAVDFYSRRPFRRVPHSSAAVARAISQTLCHAVDFPQLVETAWSEGARVFLEVGPRQNCTSWIDAVLAGRPHLAIPVDKKGIDSRSTLMHACARLLSHRVDVDLTPFYSR